MKYEVIGTIGDSDTRRAFLVEAEDASEAEELARDRGVAPGLVRPHLTGESSARSDGEGFQDLTALPMVEWTGVKTENQASTPSRSVRWTRTRLGAIVFLIGVFVGVASQSSGSLNESTLGLCLGISVCWIGITIWRGSPSGRK
jgi:hypothetical protein